VAELKILVSGASNLSQQIELAQIALISEESFAAFARTPIQPATGRATAIS
jgi:hypothetical protein